MSSRKGRNKKVKVYILFLVIVGNERNCDKRGKRQRYLN